MSDSNKGASSCDDQALVSDQAPSGLDPTGFDPSRIPWHIGCTDETYGVRVWVSRIENLRCHFNIISEYLPDDASPWLRNQIASAVSTADDYIRDYSPLCDSDGSGEAGETAGLDPEGDSADPKDIAPEKLS